MNQEETTTTDVPETTTPVAAETKSAHKDQGVIARSKKSIIGGVIAITLFALGYLALFTDIDFAAYIPFIEQPVATVNGVAISQAEFENSVTSVEAQMIAQGLDPNDERSADVITGQALGQLINAQLLIQAATEAGYEADEAAVQAQMEAMEANFGGEAALQEQLEELNLTEDMFRQDVVEQLTVNAYLEGETNLTAIEVTDEEIDTFYANIKEQYGDQVPPVEDIREQIIADIQIQKQQGVISGILADLRAAADIEINI